MISAFLSTKLLTKICKYGFFGIILSRYQIIEIWLIFIYFIYVDGAVWPSFYFLDLAIAKVKI